MLFKKKQSSCITLPLVYTGNTYPERWQYNVKSTEIKLVLTSAADIVTPGVPNICVDTVGTHEVLGKSVILLQHNRDAILSNKIIRK